MSCPKGHARIVPLGFATEYFMALGLAQLQECELVIIYEETRTEKGHRTNEPSPNFSSLAPVPHLLLLNLTSSLC